MNINKLNSICNPLISKTKNYTELIISDENVDLNRLNIKDRPQFSNKYESEWHPNPTLLGLSNVNKLISSQRVELNNNLFIKDIIKDKGSKINHQKHDFTKIPTTVNNQTSKII
jgi:hypothetical protein